MFDLKRVVIFLGVVTLLAVGCSGGVSEAESALQAELEDAQAALAEAEGEGISAEELAEAQARADAAEAALTELEAMEALGPVLVGVSLPVSGPVAISGINQINGFRLAIQEINAAGGVLGGRPIELIIEDNKCNPVEGIPAYERLHNIENVSLTYGASCSGVTLAVMPLMKEAQIPNVTGVSTNPQITEQAGVGGNEWEFRVNAPDSALGDVAGRVFVEQLGYTTFCALVSDDEFGRGAFAAQKATIEAAGGEFITEDFYALSEVDFLSTLTRIDAADCEAILVIINPDPALIAGKQYVELGMDKPWVGRGQVFSEQMQEAIGCETIEGWAMLEPWFPVDESPEAQEFVQKIRQEFLVDAVWQHLTPYTAAYVIAEAIDRAGSDDPVAIRDALEETDYDSIYGNIQFDDHNQAHGNVYAAQMQDGCTLMIIFQEAF